MMDDFEVDTNSIINLMAWIFLPNIVSKMALKFAHKVFGKPKSQLKVQKHQNMMYMTIIFAYLIYSISSTYISLGDNHFNTLGLTATSSSKHVSSVYRKLSVKYHPDRNPHSDPMVYLKINEAHEVLKDQRKRFIYDRFGDLNSCQHCKTQHDYFENYMVYNFGVFYFGFIFAISIFSIVQKPYGLFWRYMSIMVMITAELIFVTRGSPSWFLEDLTTHQKISFLHSSYVWVSVALGHLGPSFQYFWEGPKRIHNLDQRLDILETTLDSALSEGKMVLDTAFQQFSGAEKKKLINEMNLKLKNERSFYNGQMVQ
eukprot:NODE_614_length_5976_cov_0.280755.p3 type:complete len:314 gc:universal NODE_614_length_5976_cov_0.280755:5100-4159(-)